MANREENLKKINVELEKLSDEELEKVAGGFISLRNSENDKSQNENPANNPPSFGVRV